MPFLGNQPQQGFANSVVKDDFTPNGSTTAFTLSKSAGSANDIEVYVGNVRQEPTDAYTVSGTTLTMSEAVASGMNFYVLHVQGTVQSSIAPQSNSVGTGIIQNNAVTNAKIASGISSSKLTGALPAISGAALTGITSTPITVIDTWKVPSNTNINTSTTTLQFSAYDGSDNFERVGSAMTFGSNMFTFPSTGVYYIFADIGGSSGNNCRWIQLDIRLSTNSGSSFGAYDSYGQVAYLQSAASYFQLFQHRIINITNTSTHKVAIMTAASAAAQIRAGGYPSRVSFIRLADAVT